MEFLAHSTVGKSRSGAIAFLAFFILSSIGITFSSFYNNADVDFGRIIYVILFMNVCVLPNFFMNKTRGRYILLAVFMPIYFLLFGLGELSEVLGLDRKAYTETEDVTSKVDLIIWTGLFMYIIGYLTCINIGSSRQRGWYYNDWDPRKIKLAGVSCWLIGSAAFILIFFFLEEGKKIAWLPLSIISNFKNLALMGHLMIIYLYISYKDKSTLAVMLAMFTFDFFLGFAANTKEVSFIPPVLYLLLSFLATGRVKKLYTVLLVLLMVGYLSLFNTYRLFVIQIPNQTPKQAMQDLPKTIASIFHNIHTKHVDNQQRNASYLKERIETRKYIKILVSGIDSGKVKTQDGYTLGLFFWSWVPRAFYADKPATEIGQLFNWEFKVSASKLTYVPATHLGEFYWNFEMTGVIVGMLLVGALMAYISKMADPSIKVTLPRVIVLLMTIYMVIVRFEADCAQQYAGLGRVLLIIWFLDLVLRKKRSRLGSTNQLPGK